MTRDEFKRGLATALGEHVHPMNQAESCLKYIESNAVGMRAYGFHKGHYVDDDGVDEHRARIVRLPYRINQPEGDIT